MRKKKAVRLTKVEGFVWFKMPKIPSKWKTLIINYDAAILPV